MTDDQAEAAGPQAGLTDDVEADLGSAGATGEATEREAGSLELVAARALDVGARFAARTLLPPARLLPLAALMAFFVVRFATAAVDTLRAFQQDAYDMALYDQGIWLLSRFHAPFMTVMGTDMFAAHTSFIFVLLVPLYWVYPHTAALLVVQALALASGAVPVYLLGRHLLSNRALATLLAAAYLLNPAVQQGNLEQFHVEAFEAPILAFAVYAAVAWRPRLLAAMIVLLLLCKQDDALFAIPLGLWVFARRSRNGGLAIMGSAAAVGLVENFIIIPILLNGVPVSYGGWWPFGSLSGTVRVLVRKPGELANFLTSTGRPFYLWQMAFSSGLAFLVAPGILAVALPQLLADGFSSNPYLHQIFRHYSMPTAALLICASVCGVARAKTQRRRIVATGLVTLSALWGCVLWGDAPFSDNPYVPPDPSAPSVVATSHLIAKLPPGAVVSAAQNFIPNIDHRRQVYLFPTPFSQIYYGDYRNDGMELPFASQVQYLLLPSCIPCDGGLGANAQAVFGRISSQFSVVASSGSVVLYERKHP